jgi:hypothetical protein
MLLLLRNHHEKRLKMRLLLLRLPQMQQLPRMKLHRVLRQLKQLLRLPQMQQLLHMKLHRVRRL